MNDLSLSMNGGCVYCLMSRGEFNVLKEGLHVTFNVSIYLYSVLGPKCFI